jgi:nucleotide-binding universal stress UspA family protein
MKMFQSILLATDFRPASEEAAHVVVQVAARFGSQVSLLHILEPLPTWPVALVQEQEQASKLLRDFAQKLADQHVKVADCSIRVGPAADVIVHKANEINPDLILIGAGEETTFGRFTVGAIAQAVMEHSARPVLAVRPGAPQLAFQKILCPVDQSSVSRRGLKLAIRLAQAFQAELLVLTVVPIPGELNTGLANGKFKEALSVHQKNWRHEFDEFVAPFDFGSIRWAKEVRTGAAHQAIAAAAFEHQADLIVMGSTGRTGIIRLLMGSVTRRLLRQLPCSLLVVKDEDVVEQHVEEEIRHLRLLMGEAREFLRSQDYADAIAKFRQVLSHSRFHIPALEGMAEAYEKLGQEQEAQAYRDRVRAIEEISPSRTPVLRKGNP